MCDCCENPIYDQIQGSWTQEQEVKSEGLMSSPLAVFEILKL